MELFETTPNSISDPLPCAEHLPIPLSPSYIDFGCELGLDGGETGKQFLHHVFAVQF